MLFRHNLVFDYVPSKGRLNYTDKINDVDIERNKPCVYETHVQINVIRMKLFVLTEVVDAPDTKAPWL